MDKGRATGKIFALKIIPGGQLGLHLHSLRL